MRAAAKGHALLPRRLTARSITGTLRKKQCAYVEVFSMKNLSDIFSRNQGSLTDDQQCQLQKKCVAVIGCGGLGGYVIEELIRIGVGRLHLFDPDVFAPSNCNRQLHALQSTLGQKKAEVAVQRAASIHTLSTAIAYTSDFRDVAAPEAWQADVVVDCLDETQARRDLAALCTRKGLPMVHGAVNGWYGQVGVQLPGGDLIDRLYPQRTVAGTPSVLSFTVALIASLQAAETVKLLLDLFSPLHNSWLHVDLKDNDFLVSE